MLENKIQNPKSLPVPASPAGGRQAGKIQNKSQITISNFKIKTLCPYVPVSLCLSYIFCFVIFHSLFAQEQFTYDAKGKRDPFIPLVTADGRLLKLEQEEGARGLLLEGIIYDEHSLSFAIVNGEVVKVGDKIGDYQVLKIEKNKALFIKEGEITEMELKREEP